MNIEKRVQEFIQQKKLFANNAKILVALSGGADSVALLRILLRLGYQCHAVHCNFHLRDEESNRDELFVSNLCHTLNVKYKVLHFDTLAYASEHKLSIEMAARELRYSEFERLRREMNLDVIAVAHHQDDAVETLLLNLIRGAGINGLTGMRVKNGSVVRPLLCITRDEVLEFLHQIGQTYVTDSTNLTDVYARNKVRLSLLPLMQQINPAAKSNIMQAALHLGEAATIYNKAISEVNERITTPHTGGLDISIPALLHTDVPEVHLFELLHPYGFNSAQIVNIFQSLSSEAGRIFETANYTLLRDRTHLIVRAKASSLITETSYTLPEKGTLTLSDGTRLIINTITPNDTWSIPRCSDILCLDATRITQPLTLRHPRTGDRFMPFGMKGCKLLSDFYTDLKLPRTEKSQQWLLCHGNDIVWAVGQRSSEEYRIDKTPKSIICIEREKTH